MTATAVPQTEQNPEKLMEEFRATGDRELRNRLVMHYSYIAKVVAGHMRGYTTGYAQLEDIVNQGMLTLIDCVERFDPEKGAKFESYAFMRIKCANIDYIRKQDWLPRRVRRTAKEVAAAYDRLSNELMREPSIKELADALGVAEEQIQKHYSEIYSSVMISLETALQNTLQERSALDVKDAQENQPEEQLIESELRSQLAEAIEGLSERERLVVSLYYYEHLRLAEIAEVMGVSESRVCQLHSKAIGKLRTRITGYMKG